MHRNILVFLTDFVSFWLALALLIFIRFPSVDFSQQFILHTWPFILLYFSWILVFYIFELYNIFHIKPTIPHIRRFGLAVLVLLGVGAVLFYFVPFFGITPKTNLLIQLGLFTLLSFAGRRIIYVLFTTQATQPTVLIGQTTYLRQLEEAIETNPQTGLSVVGHTFELHDALERFGKLDRPLFIFEGFNKEVSKENIIFLFKRQIEIIDVAEAYERYFQKVPTHYINTDWIIAHISNRTNVLYDAILRLRDIVLASLLLLVTLPVILPFALAIYLYDRQSIFYVSLRTGLHGRSFRCYKLRSMYATLDKNPDALGASAKWYQSEDARVTPVGKIVRKLHLDEIPQMWNVVLGDMSLVGPRPERFEFIQGLVQIIPNYDLRHIVRPGFTGWAQIKFRYAHNPIDTQEKFEYDLYYIKNRNFFLDLGIIARTLQIIFTH